MSERHSQKSSGHNAYKVSPLGIIHTCGECGLFQFPRCTATGEIIKYPATGPVGGNCIWPAYEIDDEN